MNADQNWLNSTFKKCLNSVNYRTDFKKGGIDSQNKYDNKMGLEQLQFII